MPALNARHFARLLAAFNDPDAIVSPGLVANPLDTRVGERERVERLAAHYAAQAVQAEREGHYADAKLLWEQSERIAPNREWKR